MKMMSDLVEENSCDDNISGQLESLQWPRNLGDNFIDHQFNPRRFVLPAAMVPAQCDLVAISSRSAIGMEVLRLCRIDENNCRYPVEMPFRD